MKYEMLVNLKILCLNFILLPQGCARSVAPELQVFVSSLQNSAKRAHPWVRLNDKEVARFEPFDGKYFHSLNLLIAVK